MGSAVGLAVVTDGEGDRVGASVGVATPVTEDVRLTVLVCDRRGDPDTDSPVDAVIEPNRDPDADALTEWLLVVEPLTDVDWLGLVVSDWRVLPLTELLALLVVEPDTDPLVDPLPEEQSVPDPLMERVVDPVTDGDAESLITLVVGDTVDCLLGVDVLDTLMLCVPDFDVRGLLESLRRGVPDLDVEGDVDPVRRDVIDTVSERLV